MTAGSSASRAAASPTLELVRYDAMCSAIAVCHEVDEVLDIKDKARALEVYAMQVRNVEAERKACDVRLRAERRIGVLLKELQRAAAPNPQGAGGHTGKVVVSNDGTQQAASPYAQALADNAISRQSAHRYQQLADVPHEAFEDALRAPEVKPSTTRIIATARDPAPRMNEDALWLWGRARDFERAGYAGMDPVQMLNSMTDTMRADMRRIAPAMADFFGAITENFHEPA